MAVAPFLTRDLVDYRSPIRRGATNDIGALYRLPASRCLNYSEPQLFLQFGSEAGLARRVKYR